jgi:hypothetical protein
MRSVIVGTFLGVAIGLAYPLGGAAGPATECDAFAWPYYPPSCLARSGGDLTKPYRLARPNPAENSLAGEEIVSDQILGKAAGGEALRPRIVTAAPSPEPGRDWSPPEQGSTVTVWRDGTPTTYVLHPG